jgi:hypothetical protein
MRKIVGIEVAFCFMALGSPRNRCNSDMAASRFEVAYYSARQAA